MTDGSPFPSRDHRDATEAAMKLWRVNHPNRRVPKDHDHAAEFQAFGRAFAGLTAAAIVMVAEQVLDVSHGHFPNPVEVRKCARAFLQRQDDRSAGWGAIAHPLDDNTAVDAQCDAILDGLGLTDPSLSGPSKAAGIQAVMEAVTHGIQRQIADGKMPKTRLGDLRAGTYPSPEQLRRDAKRLSEMGKALAARRGAA